jgi:hypothetical protein
VLVIKEDFKNYFKKGYSFSRVFQAISREADWFYIELGAILAG